MAKLKPTFYLFLAIVSISFFFSANFHKQIRRNLELYSHQIPTLITRFKWRINQPMKENKDFVSFCTLESDFRGLHQNVIAYSLYGNFSDPKIAMRYLDPIKMLLVNISRAYPGWIMRVYSPLTEGDRLKEFFAPYPFVDLCNVTRLLELREISWPLSQATWRFLPLLDPLVDRLLSRDIDTIVSRREVTAVNQWLNNSTATFHLMRDHQNHCSPDVAIIAGIWGVKLFQNRRSIWTTGVKMFYEMDHKMNYGFDQKLLHQFIWPLARNDSLSHDSYCCRIFSKGSAPFPTRREGNEHIGRLVHQEIQKTPALIACPKKCRPSNHPDWHKC